MSQETQPNIFLLDRFPIELCQLLKLGGMAESGGEAKHLIQAGLVQLNGEVETRRGKKLMPGDQVTFRGQTLVVKER